jgi:hypothetical protein
MILLVSGATRTVDAHPTVGRLIAPRSGNAIDVVAASGRPWAADNDAFAAWDTGRYWSMLGRISRADRSRLIWVTAPDVVADARGTLNRWHEWQPQLDYLGLPIAFVGQDGIETLADEIPWHEIAGWFIGGSTEWKLSAASESLAREAKARGKWLHMGRVNSQRRMRHALEIGCDSIDGGQFSMFPDTHIPRAVRWISRAKRQPTLF